MKRALLSLILFPCSLFAQSIQGPLNATATANTLCPFAYSSPTGYSNGSNVFASDNQYATAFHCDCCDMNTKCFETTGYGFNIPLTATIDGIKVEVEKKADTNSIVQDNGVKLLKAGNVVGLSYATTASWYSVDALSVYGGSTDVWGTTWTPVDVNAVNFGLAFASISYTCYGNGVGVTSYIDHIRITVYYTDLTGVQNSQSYLPGAMLISPNPLMNGVISFSLPEIENEISFTLSDITGKIMIESRIKSSGKNFSTNIPDGLAKGIYFVKVRGASSYFSKIVIQ